MWPSASQAKRRRSFAVWAHINGLNQGDDLVVETVLSAISGRIPTAEIATVSMYPEGALARHGVPSYPIGSLPQGRSRRAVLTGGAGVMGRAQHLLSRAMGELAAVLAAYRILRHTDTLVVAGSGPLEDDPGSAYRIAKWVILARAAGARVAVLSVGAGPLKRAGNQRMVKAALKGANYSSVRDKGSADVLGSIGIAGPILVQPDMSWAWPGFRHCCPRRNVDIGGPIGVNVMSLNDPRYERGIRLDQSDWTRFNSYFAKMVTLVEQLVASGREVRLFSTESGHDTEVGTELLEAIVERGVCDPSLVVQPPSRTAEQVMEIISGCSALVTTRFHAGVLSLGSGKATIALAYHHKTKDLFQSLGIREYCLDAESFTVSQLIRAIESAEGSWPERRPEVECAIADMRRQVEAQFDTACALLHEA